MEGGKGIFKRYIYVIIPIGVMLGLAYLMAGFIAIINWYLGTIGAGKILYPDYVPGDLGLSLVMLSIGFLMILSVYYWFRGKIMKSLAAIILGLGLAVAAMVMQVLVIIASWLDSIIVNEPITYEELKLGFLRADALLGYIALPLLYVPLRILRKTSITR